MEIELAEMMINYQNHNQDFVNIVKDFNKRKYQLQDRSFNKQLIKRLSREVLKILQLQYQNEQKAQKQDIYYINLYLWQFFHSFYFCDQKMRAQELCNFLEKIYEVNLDSEITYIIQFGKFGDFLTKFQAKEVQYYLKQIKQEIIQLTIQRKNFFQEIRQVNDYANKELDLKNRFEQQKQKYIDCLEDLRRLPQYDCNNEDCSLLEDLLKLFSGDIEYFQKLSMEDLFFRPFWYILFIDPFLNQEEVKQFLNFCYEKDREYFTQNETLDKDIQLMDQEWFQVLKSILLNPSNPMEPLEKCRGVLHQVVYFFLGFLFSHLVVNNNNLLLEDRFKEELLNEYFKYLLDQNENFRNLQVYYEIYYNYENNINQDFLKKMIILNIFDNDVINFIQSKKFFSLYETCLDQWLKLQQDKKQIKNEQIFFILKNINNKHLEDQFLLIFFENNFIEDFNNNDKAIKVDKEILQQLLQVCQFLKLFQQLSQEMQTIYQRIISYLQQNKKLNSIIQFQYIKLLDKILKNSYQTKEFEISDQQLQFLINLQSDVQINLLIRMDSKKLKVLDQFAETLIKLHQLNYKLFNIQNTPNQKTKALVKPSQKFLEFV